MIYGFPIENLVFGKISNLSNIIRFSTELRLHDENVAEHSYWVAMFSFMIATHLTQEEQVRLDWRVLMGKACLHDVEESVSGDFPRPFKHSTPELLHAIETATRIAAKEVANELSPDHSDFFYHCWERAKDGTPEGCIVALADFLSVLRWGMVEVSLGNTGMRKKLLPMSNYLNTFDGAEYCFLSSVILQTKKLTEELLYAD